jgi:signal transduction histidine kinase
LPDFPAFVYPLNLVVRETRRCDEGKVVPPLPEIDHMTPGKALAVMRIVQESINNAIQHAQVHTIRITAAADNDAVRIEIADDGRGFDASQLRAGGRGIVGMRTRVKT